MKVSLVLTCAGKGVRAGFEKNKLLVKVQGKTALERALGVFIDSGLINQYVVTVSKEDYEEVYKLLQGLPVELVIGGNTRTQSVKNGLEKVTGDVVLIHDGARPFVTKALIEKCIDGAINHGGVIPVIPSRNTVVIVDKETVQDYVGKDKLFSVQTPQAFKTELIKKAFSLAGESAFNDDGEVYKRFIGQLHTVGGEPNNVKLTYPEDFGFVDNKPEYRFGVGFDCHKLVGNRKLILGGVEIAHEKGLLGHSDADVLTHAIMDACLSACAMRDIGYHFPDTDPKYKNANSINLLKEVLLLINEQGYKVESISATVMAEKPKLKSTIPTITQNLALVLGIDCDKIGIGATTLEGLGFVGREEGICVHATATLRKIK